MSSSTPSEQHVQPGSDQPASTTMPQHHAGARPASLPSQPHPSHSAPVNRWMVAFFIAVLAFTLLFGSVLGFWAGVGFGNHDRDRDDRRDDRWVCVESYPVRCYYDTPQPYYDEGVVSPGYPVPGNGTDGMEPGSGMTEPASPSDEDDEMMSPSPTGPVPSFPSAP